MKKQVAFLLSCVAVACSPALAQADIFQITGQGYEVTEQRIASGPLDPPVVNYTSGAATVGSSPGSYSDSWYNRRAAMAFDLSSIPSGHTVTSVSFSAPGVSAGLGSPMNLSFRSFGNSGDAFVAQSLSGTTVWNDLADGAQYASWTLPAGPVSHSIAFDLGAVGVTNAQSIVSGPGSYLVIGAYSTNSPQQPSAYHIAYLNNNNKSSLRNACRPGEFRLE